MPKTNPNGANQYLLDPRQALCWSYFIDPKSQTFSNALKSALKAGYTKGTANKITTEKWFGEKVRRMQMLGKAEKVLDSMLTLRTKVKASPNAPALQDSSLLKIKQDTAKFIADRLGKDEGYSTKTDITSNGKSIIMQFDNAFTATPKTDSSK